MAQFSQNSDGSILTEGGIAYGAYRTARFTYRKQLNKINELESRIVSKEAHIARYTESATQRLSELYKIQGIASSVGLPSNAVLNSMENGIRTNLHLYDSISKRRLRGIIKRIDSIRREKSIINNLENRMLKLTENISELRKTINLLHSTIVTEVIFQTIRYIAKRFAERDGSKAVKQLAKQYIKPIASQTTKGVNIGGLSGIAGGVGSMSTTANVDTSNFDRKLAEYMRYTKKSFTDVVNEKAYRIARDAIYQTFKASRQAILDAMNAPSEHISGLTVSEAIALSKLRSEGNKHPKKAELRKVARGIIAGKLRAVGFLRSGWIPALKIMSSKMPMGGITQTSVGGAKQFGSDKGGATPAMESDGLIVATIFNAIEAGGKAPEYLLSGLQTALARETASMNQYIQRKLDQAASRFNA